MPQPARPGRVDRWVEVSPSEFDHERAGLAYLKQVLPDASPYRAWTNFEFMDEQGNWNEIDALVLGRGRLHLVELKHYRGVLEGNETTWQRGRRTERSPLLLARRKAQKLASRINRELRDLEKRTKAPPGSTTAWMPYIQECVFLHAEELRVELTGLQTSNLFGFPGAQNNLPWIETRLSEPPDRHVVTDRDSQLLAGVLAKIGAVRNPLRPAGGWLIESRPIADGEGWQDWPAIHGLDPDRRARIRIFAAPPGSTEAGLNAIRRRVQREFQLLRTLHHENITVPVEQVEDQRGEPGLVYEDEPGFVALDLLPDTLTNDQQLTTLQAVANALDYAHRNGVAHRGLDPGTIKIQLTDAAPSVRLADWSSAARVHQSSTAMGTKLGTPSNYTSDGTELFEAPEGRWSSGANRPALDIFALGAVAYWLVTGELPAPTRAALRTKIRDGGGLDLTASSVPFADPALRKVILDATAPDVGQRMQSAADFATAIARIRRGEEPPEQVDHDPLTAPIGAVLRDRFEVESDLGSGSTAKGIRVRDRTTGQFGVLKVALNHAANDRLRAEAEALRALAVALPKHKHLVQLIEAEPDIGHQRVGLLLSDGGRDTLASQLRHGPMTSANLLAIGSDLLRVLRDLDGVGIMHRDIKPANIGLAAQIGGKPSVLTLFDFSLTSGVGDLAAGTPPYLDPFLGQSHRRSYDSAAERYAAAVVLFEMATGRQPSFGAPYNDPAMVDDEVTVAPGDFPELGPAIAQALTGFFRTALARNSRDRYDTPDAMLTAWIGALTGRARPTGPPPTRRRVVAPSAADAFSLTDHVGSLGALIAEMGRTTKGTSRKLVYCLLPTSPTEQDINPLDTQSVLGAAVGVSAASVSQQFTRMRELWFPADGPPTVTGQALLLLAADVRERLQECGGVTTPDQLVESLLDLLRAGDGLTRPTATARGLLRVLLEMQTGVELSEGNWVRRRHNGRIVTIASDPLLLERADAVGAAAGRIMAHAVEQGQDVVPAHDALPELRTAFDGLTQEVTEVPDSTLLLLAGAAPEVGLTASRDLYPIDLPVGRAVAAVLKGMPSGTELSATELRARVRARFPELAAAVPTRPRLDDLVAASEQVRWFPDRGVYATERESAVPMSTMGTREPTLLARSISAPADLSWLPRGSDRVFRALLVPAGSSDQLSAALQRRLGADVVDVTDSLLAQMRSTAVTAGVDWFELLEADSTTADKHSLVEFVKQQLPALIEVIERPGPPVVLTDLAVLAAYGQLGLFGRWTHLTRPPPRSIIALVPAGANANFSVDGTVLPLGSPEQRVRLSAAQTASIIQDSDVDVTI